MNVVRRQDAGDDLALLAECLQQAERCATRAAIRLNRSQHYDLAHGLVATLHGTREITAALESAIQPDGRTTHALTGAAR